MLDTLVGTKYGKVQGAEEGQICVWKGIPYARAPVGDLRFRAPQPPLPWTGVRDATKFGPIGVQVSSPLSPTEGLVQSEDCLNLNVWSPAADEKRRPVMVWIHGGGFVFGNGQSPLYNGSSFATEGDVVVVTMNYRLGPFGFLYVGDLGGETYANSGNCAILDQVAALQWVHDNIAAFGGDPQRVTVFGESAGSMSVGALLVLPGAKGLFHQAIMESGLPISMRDLDTAAESTRKLLSSLPTEVDDLASLQQVPAEQLLEAAQAVPSEQGLPWRPVVDGDSIPQSFVDAIAAGCASDIPILIGCNLNELTLWTARDPVWNEVTDDDARIRLFTERWGAIPPEVANFYLGGQSGQEVLDALTQLGSYRVFAAPIQKLANRQIGQGPIWVYRFDWQSTAADGALKACHALEIPFVFNTVDRRFAISLAGESPTRLTVANQMHHAWIAFAHNGNPNTSQLPHWPQYDLDQRPTMIFDVSSRVESDPYGDERQLWESVLGQ